MTDIDAIRQRAKAARVIEGFPEHDHSPAALDREWLLAEVDALLSRLDTARRVAVHWRDAYLVNLRSGEGGTQWAIGTHPLNLVIDALDGETNPVELGVPAEALARLDALGDER